MSLLSYRQGSWNSSHKLKHEEIKGHLIQFKLMGWGAQDIFYYFIMNSSFLVYKIVVTSINSFTFLYILKKLTIQWMQSYTVHIFFNSVIQCKVLP